MKWNFSIKQRLTLEYTTNRFGHYPAIGIYISSNYALLSGKRIC